jgi:MoaA/NifB/PqqE/SkfB family radical SAM enzyme
MANNVYNTSKLAFHREKLETLARGEITAPIYVRIKPTNRCNHHCSYCSYNPDNNCPVSERVNMKDELSREKILEILSDFKDMKESDSRGIGVKAITYSGGGEPLIYPHIVEAMRKTLEYGIDMSVITNGQKLKGERAEVLGQAEWVRVSLGESDSKSFSKTRGVPEGWFYELAENLENFSKIKKADCEFGVNFVVHRGNANQIYNSAKYFKELGLNHIKFTPVYNDSFLEYHKDIRNVAEEQIAKARLDFQKENFTVYDTYKNDFELTGLNSRNYSVCYTMQINPIIGADGVVYFCHDKSYNRSGSLGNLENTSFKELWFSKESARKFKEFNPKINCRHHCTADSRNLGAIRMINDMPNLNEYKPFSDKHKNFV